MSQIRSSSLDLSKLASIETKSKHGYALATCLQTTTMPGISDMRETLYRLPQIEAMTTSSSCSRPTSPTLTWRTTTLAKRPILT